MNLKDYRSKKLLLIVRNKMKTYPLFKIHIDNVSALKNIKEVFQSGFINEGVQVVELTNKLQSIFSSKNICLTNSCTSAITMALHLAGVKYQDDVITTPMTCVATNTPIVAMGANIVWADIDPTTGMVNKQTILNALSRAKKPKAIIVVAWAGIPPNLVELYNLCKNNDIPLILDAAHAFGAKYASLPIHEFADYSCYSFQAIKHFTTGDGGALICKDDKQFERAKALKWFGLDRDKTKDEKGNWKGQQWDTDIVEAGYKFNMNNVAASIGLSQLKYVDKILKSHRDNAGLYADFFSKETKIKSLTVPINNVAVPSYWTYPMFVANSSLNRDEFLYYLNQNGVMAGLVHVPNDVYTCFKHYQTDLPGVRQFSETQFSLPCGWWLKKNDIKKIVDIVNRFL